MEKSQHTNEQIIKVISFILSRLDTLEVEQSRHKEMFYKVRKNLTDANDLINQILDVLEVENPQLFEKTVKQFKNSYMKDLITTLDNHIDELEDFDNEQLLALLTNIVGDA
jgi:predicted nuclease with TOPRIM domain|tara:strand:+ start:379 stop:711 length:333 start_codon:yes stop_codon:yes gene_type:complete